MKAWLNTGVKHQLLIQNESLGAVSVDNYPEPTTAVRTVEIHASHFSGEICILASIELEPTDDDWFPIVVETHNERTAPNYSSMTSVSGCFIWMKAVVNTGIDGLKIARIDSILVR